MDSNYRIILVAHVIRQLMNVRYATVINNITKRAKLSAVNALKIKHFHLTRAVAIAVLLRAVNAHNLMILI